MNALTPVLIVLGILAFVASLLGLAALQNKRAERMAGDGFGVGAGLSISRLRHSVLLADRLRKTRWRSAGRIGMCPGYLVFSDAGLRWSPSFLTWRRVPAFDVRGSEIRSYRVQPGPNVVLYQVADLGLTLADGSCLHFATSDPAGLERVLQGRLSSD